ncbi:hypothetical protein LEMLEM_LOCUS10355, partial [Lemmus lemmus]
VCLQKLSRVRELKTLNLHTGAEDELLHRARTGGPLTH